jgi:hypothetical protein
MGMLGVVFGRVNLEVEVEVEVEVEGEDEVDMVLLRHRAGRWDVAFRGGGGVRHWGRRRSLESIRVQVWCIPT